MWLTLAIYAVLVLLMFGGILAKLNRIIARPRAELRLIVALIDDIKTKLDAATAKLDANTSALAGIADFITGLKQQIADLTAALIAAGNDPVKQQAVVDGLTALNDKLDAQAVAEAALNNVTPPTP